MKKYIHITKENREFLMKAFGVTGKTVQNAVRFDAERGDTDLAKKIRKVALERGGVAMVTLREEELGGMESRGQECPRPIEARGQECPRPMEQDKA